MVKHEVKSFTRQFIKTHENEERELEKGLQKELSELIGRRDSGELDLTVQIEFEKLKSQEQEGVFLGRGPTGHYTGRSPQNIF